MNAPKSRLWLVFILTFIFMLVEAIFGYLANSLALISDAGHMLSDVASILLALFAMHLSSKRSTSNLTFGYKRVEVLSGLVNGLSLLFIAGFIVIEAVDRFGNLDELNIQGGTVILVATLGLIVNIMGIYLLLPEKDGSINISGAYHHIIADTLGSLAAMIAGIGILLYRAYWLDLVVSILVSMLIIKNGLSISIKSLKILIQASPEGVDVDQVKTDLEAIHGVTEVYDFHIWRVTDGLDVLTAHILIDSNGSCENPLTSPCNAEKIKLTAIQISQTHGLHHATFQIECNPCPDLIDNCC
ncbi:MAG: cation diffusion facilitator family transporter [Candidatus Kariarchaeaceae archaeon]